MKNPKLKIKRLLIVLSMLLSFLLQNFTHVLACCSTQERVEVPACFLIDKEPKVKEGLEGAKTLVPELKSSYEDAAKVVTNVEGLISGAGGNADSAASAITKEIDDSKTKYNNLREKLGTRKEKEDTSEGPGENSLIGKLREIFGRYKVKKDGEFQKKITECEQVVNSFARVVSIQRSLLRKLKSEETRSIFKQVTEITNNLLGLLNKCVENIDLSVNSGVCLWEVADDTSSDTSVDPKSDVKKKRLPVGTKVRTKAKEREVTNDLNPELKEANAHIASPDQCKFHHIHGQVKSKEDPDGPFCGHGSVINTDIECPNCPKLEVSMVSIPIPISEKQCILFKEIVDAAGTATQERDPRLKYEQWIKELICTYLETDFTSETNIEAFASITFEAFRKNVPDRVSPNQNIIHIVARNPALNLVSEEPKKLEKPTTKRSNLKEGKSCVGITRNSGKVILFNNSKPPKTELEQKKLIPIAETAIISLFILNKIADILAEKSDAELLPIKKNTENNIKAAAEEFKKKFLSESKLEPHAPELDLNTRSSKGSTGSTERDDTNKLSANDFFVDVGLGAVEEKKGKKPITEFKASEIPRGEPLGITIPITVIFPPGAKEIDKTATSNLESIEPFEILNEEVRIKNTIVYVTRTYILIKAAFGRPVCQCLARGRLSKHSFNCTGKCDVRLGVKVISNDGKRDLTPLIKVHEERHVSDTFSAFKEKIIDGIKAKLSDPSLDAFLADKKTRIEITTVETEQGDKKAIDIITSYTFKEGSKSKDAKAFLAKLNSLFTPEEINSLRTKFEQEKEKKSNAFHSTPEGKGLTGEEGVSVDKGVAESFEEKLVKSPAKK